MSPDDPGALGAVFGGDQALSTATPTVLVVATVGWHSLARLALQLAKAGFRVAALAPAGHPLLQMPELIAAHRIGRFGGPAAIARAIEAVGPDLIVPGDDCAAQSLRRLHAKAGDAGPSALALRALIERSLGSAAHWPTVESRVAFIAAARRLALRAPAAAPLSGPADLAGWIERNGLPAVLKTDGSWGGRGVAVVSTPGQAAAAFRALARPPGLMRSLVRLAFDRESASLAAWANGRSSAVSIQAHVAGRPATLSVVCLRGEVLGEIALEVVRVSRDTGPATVVRSIANPEMSRVAADLARSLCLSGFNGFDFILDADGGAHLIEINPRAAQTSHLAFGDGQDLSAALMLAMRGGAVVTRRAPAGALKALFPQELIRDPSSPFLDEACHDLPIDSPVLLSAGLRQTRRVLGPVHRLRRGLAGWLRTRALGPARRPLSRA